MIDSGYIHSKRSVVETITHANLSDMPDTGGTNTDHDARYYTEDEVDVLIKRHALMGG